MGVLSRFERRLERSVEGAFAKVFKGHVEPVELARALQREAEERKAVMGRGRVLVPNSYVVELGPGDADRLGPYAVPLGQELASVVREHAEAQGWSFVGPVSVRLEEQAELDTGVFRVRSEVTEPGVAAGLAPGRRAPAPPAADGHVGEDPPRAAYAPAPPAAAPLAGPAPTGAADAYPGRPRLVVATTGPDGAPGERLHELSGEVTVLGRGADADVRLHDTGVSRRHAELRVRPTREGVTVELVDLGSTNGTTVNGERTVNGVLLDGDRVELGRSVLVFRCDAP